MKLRYWVAECLNDSKCYSIRGRTEKDVIAELRARGMKFFNTFWGPYFDEAEYALPKVIEVSYKDTFDLINKCLGEGSIES